MRKSYFYYTDRTAARDSWKPYFSGFSFPYHFYGPKEYRIWLWQAGLLPISGAGGQGYGH
jgi:hypothetical protein